MQVRRPIVFMCQADGRKFRGIKPFDRCGRWEPILNRKSVISLSDVCRDIVKGSHVYVVVDFGPGLITPYVNRVDCEVFLRRTPARLTTTPSTCTNPDPRGGHWRPPHQ
jgi:hypothetical protein